MSKILPLQEYVLKSGQKDTHTHKNTDTTRGKWKLVSPQTLYVVRFVRSWDVFSDWETPLVQVFLCEKKTLTNASQNCLLWNPNLKWNPKRIFFFSFKRTEWSDFCLFCLCRQNVLNHLHIALCCERQRERFLRLLFTHGEEKERRPLFIIHRREVSCVLSFVLYIYSIQKKNWKLRDHTTEEEFEVGGVLLNASINISIITWTTYKA